MEISRLFESFRQMADQCRKDNEVTRSLLQQISERLEIIENRLLIEVEAVDSWMSVADAEINADASAAESNACPLQSSSVGATEPGAFRIARPVLGPATRQFVLADVEQDSEIGAQKNGPRSDVWGPQNQVDGFLMQSCGGKPHQHRFNANESQEADLTKALQQALSNVETASQGPPDEIQQMRKQLQDRLRQAEMEISIQRARISQQHQELDEMRINLERREAKITGRPPGVSADEKENRWNRHLNKLRKE
jgi:hypothetical protein